MTTPIPASGYQPGTLGTEYFKGLEQYRQIEAEYTQRVQEYNETYNRQVTEYQKYIAQRQEEAKNQGPSGLFGAVFDVGSDLWDLVPEAVQNPVENTLSGLYWAYSRFVSQPVSFGLLTLRDMAMNQDFMGSVREVQDTWKDAKHMSPGQSLVSMALTDQQLRDRGIDFEKNIYDKSWFHEGTLMEGKFAWQSWLSGGLDLGVSWWADPTVIGGKGVGLVRQAALVRPTSRIKDFEAFARSSTMDSMINTVNRYKKQYAGSPERAAVHMANELRTMQKSINGDGLADLLARTTDDAEISDILRISMGDSFRLNQLADKNLMLSLQMNNLMRRNAVINTSLTDVSRMPRTLMGSRSRQRDVTALRSTLANNEAAIRTINSQLDTPMMRIDDLRQFEDTISKLYYNRFTTPTTSRAAGFLKGQEHHLQIKKVSPTGNRFVDNAIATPVATGVYNGLLLPAVKVVRPFMDVRPPLVIAYHESESWRDVDAALQRVRTREGRQADQEWREKWVAAYQQAGVENRPAVIQRMEQETVDRIARSYDIPEQGDGLRALYAAQANARGRASINTAAEQRLYTAAVDDSGINIAAVGEDGSNILVHPIFRTQLENSRVMTDFEQMAKIAKRSGRAIGRIMNKQAKVMGAATEMSDYMLRLWKFSVLASVSYGIRNVTDEYLSVMARFGALTTLKANRTYTRDYFRGRWLDNLDEADRLHARMLGDQIQEATVDMNRIRADMARVSPERLPLVQMAYREAREYVDGLRSDRISTADRIRAREAARGEQIGGLQFSAAGADPMFRQAVSSARSNQRFFGGSTAQIQRATRGQTTSEMGLGGWAPIQVGAPGYTEAWKRVLTRQLMNDKLAMRYISTGDTAEMSRFLRSAEGTEYRKGLTRRTIDEHVETARAAIDQLIPPGAYYAESLRRALVLGDEKLDFLDEIPNSIRPPQIHAELTAYNMGGRGSGPAASLGQNIDNVIDWFYHVVNTAPTDMLVRNPMAAALYRSHLEDLVKLKGEQNLQFVNQAELRRMEDVARQRAVKDIKDFTFNLDHMSRAAWGMRFIAPFFASKMESFQRWGRIIADKPQVVGHAGTLFNTPMKVGQAYTRDGQKIDGEGYATNPRTGERYLVPKDERIWRIQLPEWVSTGIEDMTGVRAEEIPVSIDSLNLTLQDDPIWSPGWGPVVQIPAKQLLGKDPENVEVLRELGILPLGASQEVGFTGPSWVSRIRDAWNIYNNSGEASTDAVSVYRMMDLQYRMGLTDKKPTFEEARSRTLKFSGLKAFIRFFQPFSGDIQESVYVPEEAEGVNEELLNQYKPLRFFTDAYQRIRDSGVPNADQVFLDKYGESFFAFTVAMSKNNTGIPSTDNAVRATRKYQDILNAIDPDLGGLVVGPEGIGPFSQDAYYYQLNTSSQTGSGEMQRERLAVREYAEEVQRREGQTMFNKNMLRLQADMLEAGFTSFDQAGAEYFNAQRRGIRKILSSRYLPAEVIQRLAPNTPAGTTENPFFNEAWARSQAEQDTEFYERRIFQLRQVAEVPELVNNPLRSDIVGLREYLTIRDAAVATMSLRESQDITAKSNRDIRAQFNLAVFDLMERNIAFSELHNHYLSRDMGMDLPWE